MKTEYAVIAILMSGALPWLKPIIWARPSGERTVALLSIRNSALHRRLFLAMYDDR